MLKEWNENIYCNYPFIPSRLKTREVRVGNILIGNGHPIALQSMTSTPTMDTSASVEQCIRIIEAGADIVRLTAQNIREAENLENIRSQLRKAGYETPLVADVHFNPKVAETAAMVVEKIRINPGNFVSNSSGKQVGPILIRDRLEKLLEICKRHHTALRIGVNHGSLSERTLNRFGNTPLGMVESALEYLQICREFDFHQLVFSMKSSHTHIMVQAYRLMVHRMLTEGIVYPLHLGVTEAGDGEDGRIKSAVGIGSLLADGIGDTVRVSLTEDPEKEIPVAKELVAFFDHLKPSDPSTDFPDHGMNPFRFEKRRTVPVANIGGTTPPVVVSDLSHESVDGDILNSLGYTRDSSTNRWTPGDQSPEYLYFGPRIPPFSLPASATGVLDYKKWVEVAHATSYVPLFTLAEYLNSSLKSKTLNLVHLDTTNFDVKVMQKLKAEANVVFVVKGRSWDDLYHTRKCILHMMAHHIDIPVILWYETEPTTEERHILKAAIYFGALLVDGMGDGLWAGMQNAQDVDFLNRMSFGILQATRARITRTEYISCPSCGRTLFNIQETTRDIRNATRHLKGLKIGIMGCIVNGPGEMADADYGYVGSGPGKISLYKGRQLVRRNIPSERAIKELIKIIRDNDDWVDP
jgi:(E)-4-hydroxy-3-methylbut-2-enyl-diphosphate synthase